MGLIKDLGRKAWRKYVLDGVSASGFNQPNTIDIFPFVDAVDSAVGGIAAGYDVSYETRDELDADLNWAADSIARVFGDSTPAYIGVYKKSGASGAGSWDKIGALPGGDTSALQEQVDDLEIEVDGKITNSLATDRLLGRDTAGTGAIEAIGVAGGISFNGSGSVVLTDMAQGTVKGRVAGGGTGTPTDLTQAQQLVNLGLEKINKASDAISAEVTTDLAAVGVTGELVLVNGAANIASFGTAASGTEFTLRFGDVCIITHNASSLILPGGFDIVTKPYDTFVFRSLGSGAWIYVSGPPAVLLNPEEGVTFAGTDIAGNRLFPNGGVEYDPTNRRIETEDFHIEFSGDGSDDVAIVDRAGNRRVIYSPPVDEDAFTEAEYAYVEARARTKADELNRVDLSHLPTWSDDAFGLFIFTGQSFNAGSDNARLFLRSTASWLAMAGANANTWSVGLDSRCVNSGPTYVTFGADTRVLSPLVEHYIGPTGTDSIYSDADVAFGAYPDNARGGSRETMSLNLLEWLAQRWRGLGTIDNERFKIAMNHAKTDGSIAELGTGDGLARMQSLIDVFTEAFTAASGTGAPANVPGPYTRKHFATLMNHGEADEAAGTVTYEGDVQDFNTAINTKINSEWSQTVYAPMINLQVGGKKYGTAAMVCARQQVDMMIDKAPASDNLYQFLVGTKYEVPSFVDVTLASGHPNYGDGHPTLAGNALMGVRYAIGMFYLLVRREHYWIPFPYEVYRKRRRALIAVPNKFPPMRESNVVVGLVSQMLAQKGISFEDGGGNETEVLSVGVVPGYGSIIEVECADDLADFPNMKSGKRLLPAHVGATNFRDSFNIEQPLRLPFTSNQTIYSGYQDDPLTNDLGRYLEDIPGLVGAPDLGNWMARYQVTAQPMPTV